MKLNLLLSFVCLNFFINECKTETSVIAEVEKAVEIITETTKALNLTKFTEFFEKANEVVQKFSGFLQELNQMVKIGIEIVNTIKGVDKEESELDKLKSYIGEQFAIVNGRLELIENKIDELNIVFQDELVKNKLREYLHKRDNIREMLQSFANNPNNITTSQLKKVCNDNSMRGFINFLNSQVLEGGEGSLLAAMKRGNVRKTFFQWTKNIYAMFVEANVLYSHCFTATYFKDYDEREFNSTLKADSEKFEEMLRKITNKLEKEHNEFLKWENYMEWAKKDLREMMKRHRGEEHEKFANRVTSHLSDKYDWRAWIVGSYAGKTGTFEEHAHTVTKNTITIFREENRCVFVVSLKKFDKESPEKKHWDEFGSQLWHFIFREGPHKTISREKCKNMYSIINARVPGLQIDCVRADRDLKTSFSSQALFSTFTVTTYNDNGKTRTFTNQNECDKWVHYNRRGHFHGLVFMPQACIRSTMNIIVTKQQFM